MGALLTPPRAPATPPTQMPSHSPSQIPRSHSSSQIPRKCPATDPTQMPSSMPTRTKRLCDRYTLQTSVCLLAMDGIPATDHDSGSSDSEATTIRSVPCVFCSLLYEWGFCLSPYSHCAHSNAFPSLASHTYFFWRGEWQKYVW